MHPDIVLICCIGLGIAGLLISSIGWTSLTFQENKENEYDFHDLAFYGGKLCALKNFVRGISSLFTGKHTALRWPSLLTLTGLGLITASYLLYSKFGVYL